MEITVNGKTTNTASPLTVAGLLDSLGIKPASVAVERNFRIIARAELEAEPIEEGDTIEIIRLVGGG